LKGNAEHLEVSVNGTLAVKDSSSKSIQLFHPFEMEPYSLLSWHPTHLNDLCFSADGLYLFSGGDEAVLVMWYLNDNQKTFHQTYTKIKKISVSDNLETYLFVSDTNFVGILDSSTKLNNLLQMKKMSNIFAKSGSLVNEIVFKPNSNEILLNGSNALQFYDLENDTENQLIQFQFKAVHYDPSRFKISSMVDSVIGNVSFSQNSKFIASVCFHWFNF
jgi:NET1-associated nuclear protein 1 (U3 small nucleolar RNA-associated protein 17)